jgi:hypothetical protein
VPNGTPSLTGIASAYSRICDDRPTVSARIMPR